MDIHNWRSYNIWGYCCTDSIIQRKNDRRYIGNLIREENEITRRSIKEENKLARELVEKIFVKLSDQHETMIKILESTQNEK